MHEPVRSTPGRGLVGAIASTLASRGIGVLVPLVLIPVTLSSLGADLYGLWMAVAALTGMAVFADLGLGSGLMTKLAPCYSRGDLALGRRYVSCAYLSLTAVAGSGCGLLWLTAGMVNWSAIFPTTATVTGSDARAMVLICLTAFVLNLPLSLVNRVQYACQQVRRSNLWQAAASLAALPLALGAVALGLPPLAVVAATVAAPPLVNAVNNAWVFRRELPELAPRPRDATGADASHLLRLGGLFFGLTIVMSVGTNVDNLIVAQVADLRGVAEFAVPARLYAQVGLLVSVVNLPLWPANADALARGQVDWVRRTTGRMTVASVFAVVVPSAVLIPAGGWLLGGWLGSAIAIDQWLLGGFAAWWLLLAATSPRFMVQNAAGVVRPQLAGWSAYLVLSVPAKWFGAKHLGVAVIPYVGAAVYLLTVLPSACYGYRRSIAAAAPVTARLVHIGASA